MLIFVRILEQQEAANKFIKQFQVSRIVKNKCKVLKLIIFPQKQPGKITFFVLNQIKKRTFHVPKNVHNLKIEKTQILAPFNGFFQIFFAPLVGHYMTHLCVQTDRKTNIPFARKSKKTNITSILKKFKFWRHLTFFFQILFAPLVGH
jgi:hypothetical protein